MTAVVAIMSPPASPDSSPKLKGMSSRNGDSPLTLDLSSLPPLMTPAPPSNTLLITNLNDPAIFHPTALESIKSLLSATTPLNSFSPLRSFHRIIVSYTTNDAAISARQLLDGAPSTVLLAQQSHSNHPQPQQQSREPDRIRCYFGPHTPISGVDEEADQHLKAPSAGKLFFISPPPSPPCGWESKEEDPPNKETHAWDLEHALASLGRDVGVKDGEKAEAGMGSTGVAQTSEKEDEDMEGRDSAARGRSKSFTVFHPKDHGSREDLPAVMVEDTSGGEEEEGGIDGVEEKKVVTHTARPPVELMEE